MKRTSDEKQPGACRLVFVGTRVFDAECSPLGGSEFQMLMLGERLSKRRGWSVDYTAFRYASKGVRDALLPGRLWRIWAPVRLRFLAWVAVTVPVLVRVQVDAYYQRGAYALTVAAAVASRLTGRLFIWATASMADCDSELWKAEFGGLARPGFARLRGLVAEGRDRVVAWAIRSADAVVCQTSEQAEMLAARRRVDPRRISVIPNGHPVPEEWGPAHRDNGRWRVAWVGSLKPLKRPAEFVTLAESMREEPFDFVMMGKMGDASWERSYLAPALRSNANLTYLGEVSHDAVHEVLERSAVLVSTSRFEGFPNTFVEAWMRGRPVLSLDVDPGGVIVEHGLGAVCTSSSQLAEALRDLTADEAALDQMAARCREYSVSVHDLDRTAESLACVIEGAAKNRRARSIGDASSAGVGPRGSGVA